MLDGSIRETRFLPVPPHNNFTKRLPSFVNAQFSFIGDFIDVGSIVVSRRVHAGMVVFACLGHLVFGSLRRLLVHHYVVAHQYCPPTDFIDAVLFPVAVGIDHWIAF